MQRVPQIILIFSTLVSSWLGMQAIHELGHVLAAFASQGTVRQVVLHPLVISRTDLGANPHPLFVVWGGPMFGVITPLAIWALFALLKSAAAFVARFFAGFCLVANGFYIGAGSFHRIGDCCEMRCMDQAFGSSGSSAQLPFRSDSCFGTNRQRISVWEKQRDE